MGCSRNKVVITSLVAVVLVCMTITASCSDNDENVSQNGLSNLEMSEMSSYGAESSIESESLSDIQEESSLMIEDNTSVPDVEPESNADPEPALTGKVAYLTIDDGPSRENTPLILDLLKEEGIHATFFVVPHSGAEDIYQRIVDEGHQLGNHTYTHDYGPLYQDLDYFRNDVVKLHDYILDGYGFEMTCFRFPGGSMGRDKAMIQRRVDILEELGYDYFDWHVSTGDANPDPEKRTPEILVGNVINNVHNQEKLIVLMHDSASKGTTVEALPIIIQELRELGYSFDTVDHYTDTD